MGTVRVVLKSHQPKKDGTIPILLRIISGRKSKYYSTGYSVKESQFRDGPENWVIKHPDSVLINSAIEKKRSVLAAKVYMADINGTKLEIDDLGKKTRGTFLQALKDKMTIFEQRNQVPSYNRLHAKIKLVKEAWGKDILLSELNSAWIDKYIAYRIKNGAKVTTIKKDLSDFSGVLSSSTYEGKDYFKLAQRNLKSEPVSKEKLTLKEIKLLETNKKLSGLNDIARDMFLFSFYCHGMRFQNVAMFEKKMIKDGVIKYQMNKGKKIREISVHPKLKKLLDKYNGKPYLFPVVKELITDNWKKKNAIDSANALINAHLKRVAIICGIEKNLSTHISRHTFAYLTLSRGVPMEIIKDALGHSSFAITQAYLKSLSDDKINEAVVGLYD